MGLFDAGTPKQPQPLKSKTKYKPPKQAMALINPAVQTLQQFANNPPVLPDVTPLNAEQLLAQQQALAQVGNINQIASGAAGSNNFLTNPNILTPESNPALQGWIDASLRPITEQFTTSVLPNIRGEAISAGGLGGSRQGIAEGLASGRYMRQLGDTTADIANAGYAQGLGAMIQGTNLAPQTAGLQTAGANVTGAVGQQNYDVANQARANDITNQFLPFITAQDILGAANAIPGGTTKSTQFGAPTVAPPSGFQSALGGAATGASMGSMFGPWGTGIGAGLGALYGLTA